MTVVEMQASVALWRRRHAFRKRRLDAARERGDQAGIEKWKQLLREATAVIERHKRQLAAVAAAVHPGQLWMPHAARMKKNGCGAMAAGFSPKGVLHTTEGPTIQDAFDALAAKNAWPHFCVGRDGKIVQHIALNRGARALEHHSGTIETNPALRPIRSRLSDSRRTPATTRTSRLRRCAT